MAYNFITSMIEIVEFFIYTLLKFKVWLGVPESSSPFFKSKKNCLLFEFSDIPTNLIPQSKIEFEQRLHVVVRLEFILVIVVHNRLQSVYNIFAWPLPAPVDAGGITV